MAAAVLAAAPGTTAVPSALEVLFRQRYVQLCRLAALMLRDRDLAEQVVMEAFTHTYAARGRLRDPSRAEAYLRQSVVNEARTVLRRRGREWRVNEVSASLARSETAAPVEARIELERVTRAVQKLPEQQRLTVLLRYYADLPEAQIADTLNCAVGTVKSNLSKARANLARALADSDGTGPDG